MGLPDNFEFEFVSDELDGSSVGEGGVVRPRYNNKLTLAEAIEENVLSRVYLGVHWEFDGREGERNGRRSPNTSAVPSHGWPRFGARFGR
ncbi:MAG: hypothetical protein HC857_07220 [Synechococcales cyanobacterium RU_4_20]|nr:hypothetical protein [Synechococcales cyanobacterium RU_4_20]